MSNQHHGLRKGDHVYLPPWYETYGAPEHVYEVVSLWSGYASLRRLEDGHGCTYAASLCRKVPEGHSGNMIDPESEGSTGDHLENR